MWMFPDLAETWSSWQRLHRGRHHTAFGQPLPLTYRDMRDEAARHGDDADDVFDRIEIIEGEFQTYLTNKRKRASDKDD